MSEKHSLASKARWALKSPEERKEIMSDLGKRRQELLGPEGRKKHIKMMIKARIK